MNLATCALPDEIKKSLEEVSALTLFEQRLSGKEGIVVKINDKYYMLSKIDDNKRKKIRYMLGRHLCSTCNFFCSGNLCPKVSDLSVETCRRYCMDEIAAYKESKRIEKYNFITKGVECFNCAKEYLIVSECTRYRTNYIKKESKSGEL